MLTPRQGLPALLTLCLTLFATFLAPSQARAVGGSAERAAPRNGGGTAAVAHWVSLAGPNHGTSTAWACALWDQRVPP